MSVGLMFFISICVVGVLFLIQAVLIVPNQQAVIIERLGKFHGTLLAGFHIIIPFIDRKAYIRSLKEEVLDVPLQTCITSDNVSIDIDGVLYMQVINPEKSAYGINDYYMAVIQLAQTSLRSAIGKIELDKTFKGREDINMQVIQDLNAASTPWGIKVLRYEIRDIEPPTSVMAAMEKQVQAEREKRAIIFDSEAQKQKLINIAEGTKEALIAESQGDLEAKKNQAEGDACIILREAEAKTDAIKMIKEALSGENGDMAASFILSQSYIAAYNKMAKESNTIIIPQNIADISGMIGGMKKILDNVK